MKSKTLEVRHMPGRQSLVFFLNNNRGEKLDKGAYVAVSLFRNASAKAYEKMTAAICNLYQRELGIPGKSVYVTYTGVKDWG